ncbi:MAG: glycosyltransferase family 9 protein [Candidatus Omnitrophica bacterium]|nr:glycosyltransferase family 9 protein [Candidatus Omnitrophota bacterium]
MQKRQKILVIKTGALGDMVLASVSFIAIRENYKNSGVYLLTDEKFKDVVGACPVFEKVYFLKGHILKDVKTLLNIRREKPCITFDIQGNFISNFFSFVSGGKERIGFYSNLPGKIFLTKSVKRKNILNPVDGQFPLLKKAGIKNFSSNMKVWISEKKREDFRSFIKTQSFDTNKKWIVIHPVSSEGWFTKRWPKDYFAELSDILIKKGYQIIFIGSKDGCNYIEEIIKKMKTEPVNLCGKTDFARLVLLLEKSEILITTDSGPMHIGAASGTKVLGIFGPTDPGKHCPPGVEYIYKKSWCGPCYKKVCDDLRCMKEITVDQVLNKVLLLLEKPPRA